MTKKRVLIIGAGPAGLSLAHFLSKENSFSITVIEKENEPGGKAGSFEWEGYVLDYGPHAFHRRGGELEQLVKGLYEKDPENLISGRKNVFLFLKNKLFKYPLQVKEALLKFNPFLSLRIISEFAVTSIFHAIISMPIINFEMWGKKKFGPTLYKLGFGDYSTKVWKTPPSKISEKFASEKIQGFSFLNLIRRLFKIGGQVTEPYFQEWFYPKKGSRDVYIRLQEKLSEKKVDFLFQSTLKNLQPSTTGPHRYEINSPQGTIQGESDYIVNTGSLSKFISLMEPSCPFFVQHSTKYLKYIALILVYIELDMDSFSSMHWFYLLDPQFRFNRVCEQKNLSPEQIPNHKTVLSLELTCRVGDEDWNKSDEELLKLAVKDLEKVRPGISKQVKKSLIKKIPNIYEIYYSGFDKHLEVCLSYLNQFKNIYSIGRKGLFLQGDQHQSMTMGMDLASIMIDQNPSPLIDAFYRKHIKFFKEDCFLES